jgi:hypothetical protein
MAEVVVLESRERVLAGILFMGAALIVGAGLLIVGNEHFRKREQA